MGLPESFEDSFRLGLAADSILWHRRVPPSQDTRMLAPMSQPSVFISLGTSKLDRDPKRHATPRKRHCLESASGTEVVDLQRSTGTCLFLVVKVEGNTVEYGRA